MIKKLITISLLTALLFGGVSILASEEAIVSQSVEPKMLNVSVADGQIDFGLLDLGAIKDTMSLFDGQTISNIGSVSFSVNLKVSDTLPSNWQYINALPTLTNEFSQQWALNSSAWAYFNTDNSYSVSGVNLDPATSISMDLKFFMPVAISSGVVPQTFQTSVLAVAL